MARKRPYVFLTLLLVVGLTAEVVLGDWRTIPPEQIEVGDLVTRRGQGFWTQKFIDFSTREKRFSHVGIVVSNATDIIIAHAEAGDFSGIGNVYLQEWKGFCKDAKEVAVFRYEGESSVREAIAQEALKLVGVPFDPFFDMYDTNKLYCTEMVRIAINNGAHTNLVGFTSQYGLSMIAVDDVYAHGFYRVFDSQSNCNEK